MARKRKTIDALSPLDAITGVFATILITFFALGTLAVVFDDSATMLGMGRDATVCTSADFSLPDDGEPDALDRDVRDLRDGVEAHSADIEMCQSSPSVRQNILAALSQAPSLIVFVGFLLLTRRTIRFARRTGMFSAPLALRIERLGWFLLLGLLLGAAVEWLADGLLKSSMSSMGWADGEFHVSVAGIIGAYGIISVGRVMARAADLQAESDHTI